MANTDKLTDAVALILEHHEPPTEEALREFVSAQAKVLEMLPDHTDQPSYTEEDISQAVSELQTKFSIRMPIGTLFEAEDYKPWLATKQGDIDPYYWDRYRKHLLTTKGFPAPVVRTLDQVTDKVLDHIEDPSKEGAWARRGMVVGHVQSGKTANYTGLVCKASDAGYKVIIILAGLLNSLRNQTQERIDSDFMGWCTRDDQYIGASRFCTKRRPVCLTTSIADFNKDKATTALPLQALKEPVILVLKKNKHSLERLHEWLIAQNKHNLKEFPMLMIDDEADHASVNTNKEDKAPTTINRAIRNILSIFERSSYVGYTATPFANIFIDPENEDQMLNGDDYKDLFPRDFILSLDPPDNYVGPHRIFSDNSDIDCIRSIDDNEDLLPIKHPIDHVPEALPESLIQAINSFIISRATRLLRGQTGKHNSMMINASRFTNVQNLLSGLVYDQVKKLKQSIGHYAALPEDEALKNSQIKSLHYTWINDFKNLSPSHTSFGWPEIQGALKASVDPVEVISINSSTPDVLDYSTTDYPNGRNVIAIGGLGLSRGLTLEGLLVSYFLRNSIMYDTLMQMGRWFGYRDGYADLCRIFMTDDAANWYAHIAEATEELRSDFRGMEKAKLTPLKFGLKVRSHPAALIVTARNKMRSSKRVPVSIALEGRLAETSVLLAGEEHLRDNFRVLERAVTDAAEQCDVETTCNQGKIWKGVPYQVVVKAIESFGNHPECMLTYPEPLVEYIRWMASEGGHEKFDILLRTGGTHDNEITVGQHTFNPPARTVKIYDGSKIEFAKRRVASKGDEQAGLELDQIEEVKNSYHGKNIPDKEYRKVKGRSPLFMINFVAVTGKDSDRPPTIAPTFGVSFPGDPGSTRRPKKLVEYQVNLTWWKEHYFTPDEEEEDDE
ncbi:Z1 domain-containing protein [Akkermansiaceae bacterium]|nr:Z1 domain-containing protein [Akkermansiaceae bacterium]